MEEKTFNLKKLSKNQLLTLFNVAYCINIDKAVVVPIAGEATLKLIMFDNNTQLEGKIDVSGQIELRSTQKPDYIFKIKRHEDYLYLLNSFTMSNDKHLFFDVDIPKDEHVKPVGIHRYVNQRELAPGEMLKEVVVPMTANLTEQAKRIFDNSVTELKKPGIECGETNIISLKAIKKLQFEKDDVLLINILYGTLSNEKAQDISNQLTKDLGIKVIVIDKNTELTILKKPSQQDCCPQQNPLPEEPTSTIVCEAVIERGRGAGFVKIEDFKVLNGRTIIVKDGFHTKNNVIGKAVVKYEEDKQVLTATIEVHKDKITPEFKDFMLYPCLAYGYDYSGKYSEINPDRVVLILTVAPNRDSEIRPIKLSEIQSCQNN